MQPFKSIPVLVMAACAGIIGSPNSGAQEAGSLDKAFELASTKSRPLFIYVKDER